VKEGSHARARGRLVSRLTSHRSGMRFPCTGEKKNPWRPRLSAVCTARTFRDREDEGACGAFAAIDEITLRLATNNLAEILFYGVLSPWSGIRMTKSRMETHSNFSYAYMYIYIYALYIYTHIKRLPA